MVDAFSNHLDQNSMSNAPFLMAVFGRSFVEFADFHYANNENPRRKISTIFEYDFLAVSSVPNAFVKFSQLRWAQKHRLQMEGESRGAQAKV